jgi:lysophospholipid acyltransferase (LPLAT)-like uncharacterized protein
LGVIYKFFVKVIKMLKKIGAMRWVQETLGYLLAAYLKWVQRTNPLHFIPSNPYAKLEQDFGSTPYIVAMWHGQHFMVHFAKRPQDTTAALISRHRDGEFNAIALQHLGIIPIRGSGSHKAHKIHEKGGISALRVMLRTLKQGHNVVLTADVPKVARVCGEGIVLLAKFSQCPIIPIAVVTSRHFSFNSWDRATFGLPYGKGIAVIGDPITIATDADTDTVEHIRCKVEESLNQVHQQAYAALNKQDPFKAFKHSN